MLMRALVVAIGIILVPYAAKADPALSRYPLMAYSEATDAAPLPSKCFNAAAREQAAVAMRLYEDGNYDDAYRYAGSSFMYDGSCHLGQGDDRAGGDAMFVVALVQARRGHQHAANVDVGIATAEYRFCVERPRRAGDVTYCKSMISRIDSMSR